MTSIRTLRIFLAAARHGSFARAGKEVGLTAAAVGLQVRALEEDLGLTLFDRNGRSVVLNTAGRRTVPAVEDLVKRYEGLADAGGDGLAGTVTMGALVSALMGAFADGLLAIKRHHPQLEVKLFAGLSGDFAVKVERGELDAAVVTQSPHPLPGSLVWTPLYSEPMMLIVPRRPHFTLPRDPRDILADCPFLRFDRNTWTGHLVQEVLARADVRTTDAMELNSVEAIIALVQQGFGVSIVPRLDNVQWTRDQRLRLIALPGVNVVRHVGLLERTHHARTGFTGAIKAHFQARARRKASR